MIFQQGQIIQGDPFIWPRMSFKPTNLIMLGGILLALTATAGVWGMRYDEFEILSAQLGGNGFPLANRRLVLYHKAFDPRFALVEWVGERMPCGTCPDDDVPARVRADNSSWGAPEYWLRFPPVDFSVWIPITGATGLLLFGFMLRNRCAAHGFPVAASRRAK